MSRALELAARGQGRVEPNPMVGCVIAHDDKVVGEGWHQQFGGAHAEIEALQVAGPRARNATVYVTLEPCTHQGKTPPCTQALVDAKVGRVVIAHRDPFPQVSGRGIVQLEAAGIPCEVGFMEEAARELCAPYLKLTTTGRPWILAKWAMTLDGKLATTSGDSQWISNEASRALVHQLRGRVDAVLIGRGTAQTDNPLLTARPPGPRTPARIVVDTQASLTHQSQLASTTDQGPVIVAASESAPSENCQRLEQAGIEVLRVPGNSPANRLDRLLQELGQRRFTNVLVEGGATLFGSLLDAQQIDEFHVFIAPKIIGGQSAPTPVAGNGLPTIADAWNLTRIQVQDLAGDIYLSGLPTWKSQL